MDISRFGKIVLLVFFLSVFMLFYHFEGHSVLSLSWVWDNLALLKQHIARNPALSAVSFMVLYALASTVAIPGSSVFLMVSGLLFGPFGGFLCALTGATIGSLGLFLCSRYVIGFWFEQRYKSALRKFYHEITVHGDSYLLLVRLIGVIPFFLVNALAGISPLSVKTFIKNTVLGMAPQIATYVFIGWQLNFIASLEDFFSPAIVTTLVLFAGFRLALLPLLSLRLHRKRKNLF